MFASGNNTERKRMGEIDGRDEDVVDLYAVVIERKHRAQGIGYFTIPIAVKSGIRHLWCFEINGDSVEALKRNIAQNGVSDRCEVENEAISLCR